MPSPEELRVIVLQDVETKRHSEGEPELEDGLSVNDWIGRLQGAAKAARDFARAGDSRSEYQCWLDLAAIATGRAEQVLRVIGTD